MHGPEHHFLVPAVLLMAYYNRLGKPEQKKIKLAKALDRACKVPGGFCGTHGNCGAGVGTGFYISVVTGATPLSTGAWKLSNLMTALSLLKIAENGSPRCCKRDSFLAIQEAIDFTEKHLDLKLDAIEPLYCDFTGFNKECRLDECIYFTAG